MNNTTKYVGLDVSKEEIAVAIAEEGRSKPRYFGMIKHRESTLRHLFKKLGKPENLHVCYEAGSTGYGLYRLLRDMDIDCEVIAPSLIPGRPGDKIKTDKRDAVNLASLHRAGELTSIYVPSKDDEALRDLTRAREDVKEDEQRSKHRLSKFLLRHDLTEPEGVTKWTTKYWNWIEQIKFERSTSRIVFQEYIQQIKEYQNRLLILEKEIEEQATKGIHAKHIQAFMTLRGVALITATSIVAEVSSFQRFLTAPEFMAYTGLIPSEKSSGPKRSQGRITKTGNRHIRRLLIEAAHQYRHQPTVRGDLKKRQHGQPASILDISWKAQNRLHKKYHKLLNRNKEKGKVIAAVARELAGFIWAIGLESSNTAKSK